MGSHAIPVKGSGDELPSWYDITQPKTHCYSEHFKKYVPLKKGLPLTKRAQVSDNCYKHCKTCDNRAPIVGKAGGSNGNCAYMKDMCTSCHPGRKLYIHYNMSTPTGYYDVGKCLTARSGKVGVRCYGRNGAFFDPHTQKYICTKWADESMNFALDGFKDKLKSLGLEDAMMQFVGDHGLSRVTCGVYKQTRCYPGTGHHTQECTSTKEVRCEKICKFKKEAITKHGRHGNKTHHYKHAGSGHGSGENCKSAKHHPQWCLKAFCRPVAAIS